MAKDSVNISIPYFFNRKGLNENISLEELEKFSEPIIDKAISSVWKALDNAGITKEELDLVILAGGSSQLPGVYEKISENLGIEPRIIPKNLMLAISSGAALYQREIFDYPKVKRETKRLGHSLGLMIDDGGRRTAKEILNHKLELPATCKQFFYLDEGQTKVSLNLVSFMGDSDKISRRLKQRTLELSKNASQIDVEIAVDENRLIQLKAYDPKNKDKQAIIQLNDQMMTEKEIKNKRKELGLAVTKKTSLKEGQPCIGIDLGTTTTELAYTNRSGETKLDYLENPEVPSQYSKYCFPSVVYFKNGLENPEISNIHACNALGDLNVKDKVCSNFKIADRESYFTNVDDKGISVCDLSAMVLNKVWLTAQNVFGDMNLKSAVITVPASFDSDKCQDTYNAAKMAGIENVTLIDEPTAAFLYYKHIQGLDTSHIKNVLVFDFGGGTTDVAVLDVQNDDYAGSTEYKDCLYTVLGMSGDDDCGGKHIDDALVNELKTRFEDKNNCVLPPHLLRRLREEVEKAKVKLSEYYSEMGDL